MTRATTATTEWDRVLLGDAAPDVAPASARADAVRRALDQALAEPDEGVGLHWVVARAAGRTVLVSGSATGVRRVVLAPPAALVRLVENSGGPLDVGMARAAQEIEDYLAGRLALFSAPVDLRSLPAFQRAVLEETRRIPRGSVATYAQVAERIGRPRAQRAVGTALGHNPVPLIVPCHRVVRSSGDLGNYSGGGPEMKRWLLNLEGTRMAG